jgi:hypothetical protein
MFQFLYCMQFLLNVFHMGEFHKEFNMRSLIVPLIGFNELWHHLSPFLQHTRLHSCSPEYCMYCPVTLHNFDVIQNCNGR